MKTGIKKIYGIWEVYFQVEHQEFIIKTWNDKQTKKQAKWLLRQLDYALSEIEKNECMKKFKDFYEAWWLLYEHPTFNDHKNYRYGFQQCLMIDVQKVNPKTRRVEDDEKLNTHTEIWLECGEDPETHDIRLDCGGDTFEEAIIELANLVKKYY